MLFIFTLKQGFNTSLNQAGISLDWHKLLGEEKQKDYFIQTLNAIRARRQQGVIVYPPQNDVFNAFALTPFDKLKVVIIGQDPYHRPNQAHGLCFSVKPGIKIPPSLVNIYKELARDSANFRIPDHGFLESWAKQGVLLLNTVLTVEQGKAHSHKHLGWETFTDSVIEKINQKAAGIVFLLWGSHAQKKGAKIDTNRHCVLKTVHPSPLSAYRGFIGCGHFSSCNQYLEKQGKTAIDWQV
ncbi:MAG: uracil-DNA glycosylase [Enterobacterales bacterium]|nr:uracil-DNA glycosylase [Enterobacterales bacterium]